MSSEGLGFVVPGCDPAADVGFKGLHASVVAGLQHVGFGTGDSRSTRLMQDSKWAKCMWTGMRFEPLGRVS